MKSLVFALLVQMVFVAGDYWVPRPDIDALYPRGFRVTIPHEQGITLFAFHGNINQDLPHLAAGRFSKDVLHRTGNSWVFMDRSTELHVGDKINFWLYVLKDGIGHRYDGGEYWVKPTSWSSEENDHSGSSEESWRP